MSRHFAAAFQQLSEKEKALLEYRFMDGLSSDEIGRKLGIKPSAVRQAVLRAKQHVLEYMSLRRMETMDRALDFALEEDSDLYFYQMMHRMKPDGSRKTGSRS